MNAAPLLDSVVATMAEVRLEAILIGNAAAAIQGAPVTTVGGAAGSTTQLTVSALLEGK